jgi:hypothetical protein
VWSGVELFPSEVSIVPQVVTEPLFSRTYLELAGNHQLSKSVQGEIICEISTLLLIALFQRP